MSANALSAGLACWRALARSAKSISKAPPLLATLVSGGGIGGGGVNEDEGGPTLGLIPLSSLQIEKQIEY